MGLLLGLRSVLTLEVDEMLLRVSTTLAGLLPDVGDGECLLTRWALGIHVLPLSLGVRLCGAAGLIARRRRFGEGETERDFERPRDERRE